MGRSRKSERVIMLRCRGCGAIYSDRGNYCPSCGLATSEQGDLPLRPTSSSLPPLPTYEEIVTDLLTDAGYTSEEVAAALQDGLAKDSPHKSQGPTRMVRWHTRARDYLASHRAGDGEGTLECILYGLAAQLDTEDCFVIFADRAAPEAYVQLTDELCVVDSRVLSEAQQLVLKKMGFHSPEDSAGGNLWRDTQDLGFEALAALVEQALVVLGSEPGFTVSEELPLPAPAPVRSASGGEPREELAWFTPAMEARRTKRWADVEALTRERLSNSPDHSFAHEVLAEALEKQGKIEEAIVHYEQAIAVATGPRRNPWFKPCAQPFKKLDILCQRSHQYDESLRVCKSYVEYHGYGADAWSRLRRAADRVGLIELVAQAKAKYEHLK